MLGDSGPANSTGTTRWVGSENVPEHLILGMCDSTEVLIIYAFAVLLAQVVNDHMVDPGESNPLGIDDQAAAVKYFGSVQNTMLKPASICGVAFHFSKSVNTNGLIWVYHMKRMMGQQASPPCSKHTLNLDRMDIQSVRLKFGLITWISKSLT